MAEDVGWLRAGRVGRPHGLDGSFHVSGASPALLVLGRRVMVGGRELEIVRRSGLADKPILRLEGCAGRTAAEELRGEELLVPRSAAPPLEEDEWWAEELEGCRVHDGAREVGEVRRLQALPSCEVLEIARAGGGPDLLVPLIRDAVRGVDVEARRIEVDLDFLGEGSGAEN